MDIKIVGEIGYDVDATLLLEDIKSAEEDIVLHILSGGGSAIHGLAIYDALKASDQKVYAKIYGFAASAASVIAMGADVIEMGDGGLMMIHEPWSMAGGNAKDLEKEAQTLDIFSERLIKVYQNKTGLEYDRVKDLVSAETWMSADEAIEMKFADSKLESFEVAASANLLLKQTNKENSEMSETVVEAKEPQEEVKADSAEKSLFAKFTNWLASEKEETQAEAKTEEVEAKAEPEAEEVKEEVKAQANHSDLKIFMASFGDAEGAKMFADGVTFEAAQQKHIENQNDKIEELQAKLAEQSTIIEASKKNIGGEALALGATEPKAKSGAKIRFQD